MIFDHLFLDFLWLNQFQAEVCHLLFLHSVDFTESAAMAGTPPDACIELPTCPVCLGETQKIITFFFRSHFVD